MSCSSLLIQMGCHLRSSHFNVAEATLLRIQFFSHGFRKAVEQLQERSIRPAEPDYIHLIAQFDVGFGRLGHNVVLFPDVAIAPEIFATVERNSYETRSASAL